jgi:hypothetical protein
MRRLVLLLSALVLVIWIAAPVQAELACSQDKCGAVSACDADDGCCAVDKCRTPVRNIVKGVKCGVERAACRARCHVRQRACWVRQFRACRPRFRCCT